MADVNDQLSSIFRAERDGVKAEARIGGTLPLVAAASMEIVSTRPTMLRKDYPVQITGLEGLGEEVRMVPCPGLLYKTLWVTADNDRYRQNYLAFLRQSHGLQLERIPEPFDVDHMFNRARALRYGYKYVRLALVDSKVNQSHGAGYEKTVTRGNRERLDTTRALMDEIGCMKFFGFMNPSESRPRKDEIDSYARFAAAEFGMSEADVKVEHFDTHQGGLLLCAERWALSGRRLRRRGRKGVGRRTPPETSPADARRTWGEWRERGLDFVHLRGQRVRANGEVVEGDRGGPEP